MDLINQMAKIILREENVGIVMLPDFMFQSYSNLSSMYCHKKQALRPKEQKRKPRNKSKHS
jgi:hypothetical protein